MEKGFNDDELEDIMNEIESLEQEFSEESFDTQDLDSEPNLDEVAESVQMMAREEEALEDKIVGDNSLLEEVASMSVEDIVPVHKTDSFDDDSHHNIIPMTAKSEITNHKEKGMSEHSNTKSATTAMNFSVEGDMKLDLSFLIGESEVKLHISDQGFEIELEGGAKFSLPVHTKTAGLKAA